jgi:hypothetical protein
VANSGDTDVSAFPNTYQGFNWALLHLRNLYAPNVLLAFHVSDWATAQDIGSNTNPSLDATTLGQEAGAFAAQSGITGVPNGTSTYDVLFNDVSDRDAAYYKYVYGNNTVFWDRLNVAYPNFHRWESYVTAASVAAGRSFIIWQIPEGNQYFDSENNTNGHYQDNRAEYFFGHIPELVQSHIVGLIFGAGNGGSTVNWDADNDGVVNPSAFCTTDGMSSGQVCNNHAANVSDDDGGYIRMEGQQYYAGGGYPLQGGGGTVTPTNTATSVPTPLPTNTSTNTPTKTPTIALTSTLTPTAVLTHTATPTPTSTPIPSGPLVLGNFEGTKEGWSANSDVTSMAPSTYAPAVALGKYALKVQYKIPGAWSEAQLFKAVNVNLSAYNSLSVSVYALRPSVSSAGVKVRLFAQGSDGNWYSSSYQSIPLLSLTRLSWNMSNVPRTPLKQLYVAWQFTTAATGAGSRIYFDAIEAS